MDVLSNSAFTRRYMPTFFRKSCLSDTCLATAKHELNFQRENSATALKKLPTQYMKIVGLLK